MRTLRTAASMSLREVETVSGWGRGTLSQVETGKSRPALALVEWYDDRFGADGLLVSLYVEACAWHGRSVSPGTTGLDTPGDSFRVESACLPAGHLVGPGDDVKAGWTIVNTGSVPWVGRSLRRVGAVGSNRLIVSRRSDALPDCAPGDAVDVQLMITAPAHPGTVVAYWEIVDARGALCFPGLLATNVVLVVA